MKKLALIASILALTCSSSFAAEPQKPTFGPLLDMFGSTTIATAYYAKCKDAKFSYPADKEIRLMENNVALRTLTAGYLLANNKDVKQATMVEFIKAAAQGLVQQTRNSIAAKGCASKEMQQFKPLLAKATETDIQKAEKKPIRLTADKAKAMLESMK